MLAPVRFAKRTQARPRPSHEVQMTPNCRFVFPFALALLFAPQVEAQEPTEAQATTQRNERALSRTRGMLEARPTHAALFDRFFKLLVETNSVDAEIESLRAKMAAEPDDAVAVILGRTLLRAGKEDEALEALEGVGAKSAEVQLVLGDIYLKLAKFDLATRAFNAALPAADNAEKKRVVYEKLGQAWLALGRKDTAIETWNKISELDGGKFYRRLHVAELFADAGLLTEASEAYIPLIAESKDDPPRHCQVLRDVGRLRELQGDLDAALTTYRKVLELTGRGNWLRKEVEKRVVQIYRRTGRVEELVAQLQQQAEESPDDLAISELLADVLLEMRELDRAVAVLGKVSPRFPKDVRLARRLATLHMERDDLDAAIAEYQRIIGEKPEELELYMELGTLFARSDRVAEAKNQWDKALGQNIADASLCTRLAAMYALWDENEDAIRLYRRAIELEPQEMVRRLDLAEFQYAHDDAEGGAETLRAALEAAGESPRRLEILTGALREHDMVAEARDTLERILAIEPDNQEIRFALADLMIAEGDVESARPLLWHIIEFDGKALGHRTLAANTLVNLAARAGTTETLIEEAKSRESAGAAFVAGRAHTRRREFDRAITSYRTAIERKPLDLESRQLLARLLAEEGDFEGALREYAQIGVVAPGEKQRSFREIAQLHLELYDLDAAVDTWEKAMRDNPDNASIFLQVGKEFMEINRLPEALRALEQAARLRSNDPDVLLRYADALRQFGKIEEAEERLRTVATVALESRDRELARRKLFELYAEQGSLDKKVAEMQSTVEENPYDATSPQLLADLYNRTGDFLLGLEMIERSVKFQPRNRELLTRRAELLAALEEWEKARDQHLELLKFPDADRDMHLASIGKAQFEIGEAEEAKATFRKIRDRGQIRTLYDRYRLHDEAIEYFSSAVARNPSDFRSYYYLAVELEKRSRRDEAIESLEKCLNLRPYYQQALELVGKLYVQAGRREESVAVGMRMFGLRGEAVEKSEDEQLQEELNRTTRRRYSYNRRDQNFSQRRLDAAKSYFEERGLNEEWGKILVAEAKRRPADNLLFNEVRSHFKWYQRSGTKLAAFIDELLAADWSRVRVPPGETQRSYRRTLEAEKMRLYADDASVADARLEALDKDDLTVLELLERAKIHEAQGQLDSMIADLEKALTLEPLQPVASAMIVEALVDSKRYADAVPHVENLIRWWDEGGEEEVRPEREAQLAATFKRMRKGMLDSLPRRVRRRVTDDHLREVRARTKSSSWHDMSVISFPEAVPERFACYVKLIRLRKAAGQEAELTETVRRAMADASTLSERGYLGRVLFQEGFKNEARQILETVISDSKELREDPIQVYFWSNYSGPVNSAAEPLGEILAESGETFRAYQLLRDHGHAQKAELILRTSGETEAIVARLEQMVEEAKAPLAAARADASSADLRTIELDYRDAVIKLADYCIDEQEFERAESIYEKALELLPDDLEIRDVLAKLRLRRGDHLAAIAMHDEIISVKRRRRRAEAGEKVDPPTRLKPRAPGQSNDRSMSSGPFISSGGVFYSSGRYYSGYGRDRFDVGQNYEAILDIYSDRNDPDGVLGTLRKILREDPATFRNMSYDVLNSLRNQDLGKKKLPVLRILKSVVKNDEWLSYEYGKACREEDELKEARRTFEKMLARATTSGLSEYYLERAESELEKVLQKLGEAADGIPELRAKVEAEPENVRHRMRLAKKLNDEHDYAGALAEAQVIVEKAPYMMKAKEMVVETAAAANENAIAIEMLRRLFDESTSTNDKLRRGVTLANWLYAAGEEEEAIAIVDGLEDESGGSSDFSAGNWFLDKNHVESAMRHFESEFEKAKHSYQWQANELRRRLARLELATGKFAEGVGRYLEALEEAGSLNDREERFKDLLRMAKGHPDPDALLTTVEAAHGAREEVQDHLVISAVQFARGDAGAAEAEIRKAVEVSPKEVYLYPVLLGLRRLHDDFEGALSVLDEMQRVYGGSDSMRWSNGVSLTEREQIRLVRAQILEDAGRAEEAAELVESILDETEPGTMQKLSQIYEQRGSLDKALDWHRRWVAKLGTREQSHLLRESKLLLDIGKVDEALALTREAWIMDQNDSSTRNQLTKIYRDLDRLPEFVVELEERFAKDFRDSSLRSLLMSLYKELDRDADRIAILEKMLEHEDLEESALRSLIQVASENDDIEAVLGYLRRQLELTGGSRQKSIHRQISQHLVTLDRIDEAEAAYREAIEVDTADGQRSLGNWLRSQKRYDKALAAFEKVLELDPDNEDVTSEYLATTWQAQRWPEVLDRAMAHLDALRGRAEVMSASMRRYLLDAHAGLSEEDRAKALAGDWPGEFGGLVATTLHHALGNWTEAVAAADRVLAEDASNIIALDVRRSGLRYLDDLPALFDATEALRAAIEQEYVVQNNWSYNNRARDMQDQLGRIALEMGDEDRAEATWRLPPIRRTPYSNPFYYYSNNQMRFTANLWMDVRRPDRALQALEREFLLNETAPWSTKTQALEQVGRDAEVEEFAWKRMLDPLELYGIQSGSYGWIYVNGEWKEAQGMQDFLVAFYKRRNRLDELRSRAKEMLEVPATRRQARDLLEAIANDEKDPLARAEAESARQAREYKNDKPGEEERVNLARLWHIAGQHEKSLALLQEVLDFKSEGVSRRARRDFDDDPWHMRRGRDRDDTPFSFGFDSSYSSYWSWRDTSDLETMRAMAASVLFSLGREAEANAIEAHLTKAPSPRLRKPKLVELANNYSNFEAHQNAARVYRELLDNEAFELDEDERIRYLGRLLEQNRRADDREAWRATAALLVEAYEAKLAEAPGPHDYATHQELAELHLGPLEDPQRALRHLDFLLKFSPRNRTYLGYHARAMHLAGEPAKAVAELRALSELRRARGEKDTSTEEAWLGLAQLASGDRDAARATLTGVVLRISRTSDLSVEVRKALEGL